MVSINIEKDIGHRITSLAIFKTNSVYLFNAQLYRLFLLVLKPGEYIIVIVKAQLKSLGLKSVSQPFYFTIKTSPDGDIKDRLDIILQDTIEK